MNHTLTKILKNNPKIFVFLGFVVIFLLIAATFIIMHEIGAAMGLLWLRATSIIGCMLSGWACGLSVLCITENARQ